MIDLYAQHDDADVIQDDAQWLAQATADIALQLATKQPALQSPLLKLVKERNEARELLKRVLAATDGMTDSKEYYAAMLAAHTAAMKWKEADDV